MMGEALRATPLLLCLFSSLLLWCTAPPPLTIQTLPKQWRGGAFMDSLCSFKAFGDIKFSLRGERHSLKIDVVWRGDSDFTIALYSPLGRSLLSVTPDSLGAWRIIAADTLFTKGSQDRVSLNGYFDYSLTFSEFLRAATGRLLDTAILEKPSDSLSLKGKKAFLYWRGDSTIGRAFDITAVIDRKHFSILDVIYSKKALSVWELSISSNKRGAPEEIRFKDQNNNYFYVAYKTVIVKHGKHCRSERL